jgi:hypothetical protein
MTLETIINNSKLFTDENYDDSEYVNASNRAISLINTECKTLFSDFSSDLTTTYTDIPKSWLYSLISPYLSYTIKMNDSSLSEADRYLDEFYKVLNNFKDNLGTLVEVYENGDTDNGVNPSLMNPIGFGGVYQINTENAINVGFFGNQGNGGSW